MVGEQIIGSDMSADTHGLGYLDEVGLSQFLDEQKALPTHPVIDYAFVTSTLGGTLTLAGGKVTTFDISDISNKNFVSNNVLIWGVPENLLYVTGTEFYEYKDLQEGPDVYKTDGEEDAISLLYSTEDVD